MSSLTSAQNKPSPTPAINLNNIHLNLSSDAGIVHILRGINLEINAGECIGVVGPSGSGKTSMLMVLAGLEAPTTGTVTIAGRDLTGLDEDQLALFRRENVGIVFQNYHLVPTMSALENVAVPLEFAGRSDAFERAREHLETVGLGHRLEHYPGQLSGGEQQRVALARAFAVEPAILLADEPTGNLDQETGTIIMDLLFSLQEKHDTTMVLVTHEATLAERCSRLVTLGDGNVIT